MKAPPLYLPRPPSHFAMKATESPSINGVAHAALADDRRVEMLTILLSEFGDALIL